MISRPEARAAGQLHLYMPVLITSLLENEPYFHATMAVAYCSYYQATNHGNMGAIPHRALYHYSMAVRKLLLSIQHQNVTHDSFQTVLILAQVDVSKISSRKECHDR
jgi:hypothetical protein